MDGTIKVVIVCPNRLLRDSLARDLSQQACITVVDTVGEVLDLPPGASEPRPDLVITDFSSIQKDRPGCARQLRSVYPDAKLLVIGLDESRAEFLECIEAGALGCLSMEASLEDLHHHIQAIAAGGALCSPEITRFLLDVITENAVERERLQSLNLTQLTRREREIIALIEEGLSNKEIAGYLKIELQTVKNHVHNILEKLQLSNRREAAKYVREESLAKTFARPKYHHAIP